METNFVGAAREIKDLYQFLQSIVNFPTIRNLFLNRLPTLEAFCEVDEDPFEKLSLLRSMLV